MNKLALSILIVLLIPFSIFCQQNPPSVKWQSIESEHFEVVFPAELKKQANYATNELEFFYHKTAMSLDTLPKKITIFFFNRSAESNGFVRLFPRYSAWYTTPNSNALTLGNDNWLRSMGIHEYRHVVQFAKANQKFTKFVSRLFGDLARTGLAWSVPFWFVEGDAVVAETALTQEGRGRLASFTMPVRTSLLENRSLSYEQAYLGSYRKYFPNYYSLGYWLSAYGRHRAGTKTWSKVTNKYSSYPFYPFAFSLATKRVTGYKLRPLYHAAMDTIQKAWSSLDTVKQPIGFSPKRKVWTNYTFPFSTNNGTLALRKGYGHANSIVQIDSDGKEKYIGRIASDQMHYSHNKIVWVESESDLRWGEQSNSNIWIHNLKTNTKRKVTTRKKFFSPALSPNGQQIATIENNEQMESRLVVLETANGTEIIRLQIGENETLRSPRWSVDGKKIVLTHAAKNGAAISVIDIDNQNVKNIIPHTWENISWPSFAGKYILYNSNSGGVNSVCAIDTITAQHWQSVASKYGALHAHVNDSSLVYQYYTANGFALAQKPFRPSEWLVKDSIPNQSIHFHKPIVQQEAGAINWNKLQIQKYTTNAYPWYRSLINFHSLMLYPNTNGGELLALSRNKLNTFDLETGVIWNNNEQRPTYKLKSKFKMWFPILSLGATYTQRKATAEVEENKFQEFRWHQTEISAGVQLPFNFSRGQWQRQLSLSSEYLHTFLQDNSSGAYSINSGNLSATSNIINFYSIRTGARKDISYRLGISSSVFYKKSLTAGNTSHIFATSNRVYLPGIGRHHALALRADYEKKLDDGFQYSSSLSFPRGYTYYFAKEMKQFSANYRLPLLYPDLRLGSLLYTNRIHSNIFYDLGQADKNQMQSLGVELYADVFFLQIKFPFTFGVRFSQRLNDNKHRFEGIMAGLNLNFY